MTEASLRACVIGGGPSATSMIRYLTWHGVTLAGYDPPAGFTDTLVAAESPRDAVAGSDVVFLTVAEDVERLLAGPAGVLADPPPGLTVIATSAGSLGRVYGAERMCRERAVAFLDMGVITTGGPTHDHPVVAIGGDPRDVECAMPILLRSAWSVFDCGSTGSGTVAKMMYDAALNGRFPLLHQAAGIAQAAGVAFDDLEAVFAEAAGGDDALLRRLRRQLVGHDEAPLPSLPSPRELTMVAHRHPA